jgi:hypothetical protein
MKSRSCWSPTFDLDRVRGDCKKVPWPRDRRIDLYAPLVQQWAAAYIYVASRRR